MIDWSQLKTAEQREEERLQGLADAARSERDRLLAACDWTQVSDAPVNASAWATYRQALRDVPGQVGFPEVIVWPEVPNAG